MRKLSVEKVKRLIDGNYQGIIKAVEFRDKPYEYTDLVIETDEDILIRHGVPTSVTMESRLGKLLIDFGANMQEGGSVTPEEVFVGKKCTFMVMNKAGAKGGMFPNVVPDSLKCVKS